MEPGKRTYGFSLIEIMIVVAIIGILTMVAYPSYQDHVRKSKRAAAKAVLADLANRQQSFLIDSRSFATSLSALNSSFSAPSEIANDFTFAVSAVNTATPPTFSVTATPASAVMLADKCGMSATVPMSLDQSGAKTPVNCW